MGRAGGSLSRGPCSGLGTHRSILRWGWETSTLHFIHIPLAMEGGGGCKGSSEGGSMKTNGGSHCQIRGGYSND